MMAMIWHGQPPSSTTAPVGDPAQPTDGLRRRASFDSSSSGSTSAYTSSSGSIPSISMSVVPGLATPSSFDPWTDDVGSNKATAPHHSAFSPSPSSWWTQMLAARPPSACSGSESYPTVDRPGTDSASPIATPPGAARRFVVPWTVNDGGLSSSLASSAASAASSYTSFPALGGIGPAASSDHPFLSYPHPPWLNNRSDSPSPSFASSVHWREDVTPASTPPPFSVGRTPKTPTSLFVPRGGFSPGPSLYSASPSSYGGFATDGLFGASVPASSSSSMLGRQDSSDSSRMRRWPSLASFRTFGASRSGLGWNSGRPKTPASSSGVSTVGAGIPPSESGGSRGFLSVLKGFDRRTPSQRSGVEHLGDVSGRRPSIAGSWISSVGFRADSDAESAAGIPSDRPSKGIKSRFWGSVFSFSGKMGSSKTKAAAPPQPPTVILRDSPTVEKAGVELDVKAAFKSVGSVPDKAPEVQSTYSFERDSEELVSVTIRRDSSAAVDRKEPPKLDVSGCPSIVVEAPAPARSSPSDKLWPKSPILQRFDRRGSEADSAHSSSGSASGSRMVERLSSLRSLVSRVRSMKGSPLLFGSSTPPSVANSSVPNSPYPSMPRGPTMEEALQRAAGVGLESLDRRHRHRLRRLSGGRDSTAGSSLSISSSPARRSIKGVSRHLRSSSVSHVFEALAAAFSGGGKPGTAGSSGSSSRESTEHGTRSFSTPSLPTEAEDPSRASLSTVRRLSSPEPDTEVSSVGLGPHDEIHGPDHAAADPFASFSRSMPFFSPRLSLFKSNSTSDVSTEEAQAMAWSTMLTGAAPIADGGDESVSAKWSRHHSLSYSYRQALGVVAVAGTNRISELYSADTVRWSNAPSLMEAAGNVGFEVAEGRQQQDLVPECSDPLDHDASDIGTPSPGQNAPRNDDADGGSPTSTVEGDGLKTRSLTNSGISHFRRGPKPPPIAIPAPAK
ncbi:hypothetical protein HDU96_009354 [Phlyctochytrium bullatum]|nr:hypothetical protein HDU96_009354 [Phlyctochytrium bullatum]